MARSRGLMILEFIRLESGEYFGDVHTAFKGYDYFLESPIGHIDQPPK